MTFTPLFRFPDDSPFRNIVIKREDLSETGSHKFRSLKKQMEDFGQQSVKHIVLSTTGNAGITASHYGKELGMQVLCLMSDQGDMSRAAQVEKEGGLLILTPRPKHFSNYLSKKFQIPLIRASLDDEAMGGYRSLGEEIREEIPDAQAIVNFSTSGTSSIGLMSAYAGTAFPALHVVQRADKEIAREKALTPLVKVSHGEFWTVSDDEQRAAEELLRSHHLETSWEGISSFAVAQKIADRYDPVVVIFSGRKWPLEKPSQSGIMKSLSEIDHFLDTSLRLK